MSDLCKQISMEGDLLATSELQRLNVFDEFSRLKRTGGHTDTLEENLRVMSWTL